VCAVTGKDFARLFHLIPIRIIRNYYILQGNITKHPWEENGVCGGDIEITAIIGIYNKSVSIYFVFESQFTQPSADVVGDVTEEKIMLLNCELDCSNCDTEMLGIFDEVCFYKQASLKRIMSVCARLCASYYV
jgi:hypothetical protein